MRKNKWLRRFFALVLSVSLIAGVPGPVPQVMADGALVLTLGADLTEEQKQGILDFFNVQESDAMVITVTNADERKLLEGQYTEAQIGTKTFSCALVNPTASGGIQVKTANMNIVTSGRIASILSTSGITDCEVLTAAPFMVSGTGALTGVMMGYEEALGVTLDPEKQQMAIEESTTVSQIGETMGQNEATLVVNDIKIRIVRDQAKEPEQIRDAVNTTVDQVEEQLEQLAVSTGNAAPEKLDEEDREVLYDYGDKISKMNYDYNSMKLTLQRVTLNAAREIGIDDPITETFEDLSAEDVLAPNSILLSANDESMGEDANITATDTSTLEDAPSLDKAVATAELRGSLYALFDLSMTWTEARRYCRDLNGDLASISTLEEQEVVEQLAAKSSKDYSWLGGKLESNGDHWWWSNGHSFRFSNWDENQPDGADNGEYFMRMANRDIVYSDWTAHAGKWNDAREDGDDVIPLDAFGFICEIEQEKGKAEAAETENSYAVDPNAHVTDVRLTPVSSVENGRYFLSETSLIVVRTEQGDGLATIDGTLMTDQWFYSIYSPQHGLIEVSASRDNRDSLGVLAQNGKLVVPCAYADIKIVSPRWVIAISETEGGSEEDYDYKSTSLDDKVTYYTISGVDVYYVNDGEGTLVGSLAREDFSYAEAKEDYINIENRNGVITTFDSTFQVVANDVSYGFGHIIPEEYSVYQDYETKPSAGVQDANGNIVMAPFADYIYEISDGYVCYSMYDEEETFYGLVRLDGTEILPPEFEYLTSDLYSTPAGPDGEPLQLWNHGGYYSVVHNGMYGFAQNGGTVTCETDIPWQNSSDFNYTRCDVALAKKDDDTVTLYAADGQITTLEGSYSSFYSVDKTMGMIWSGNNGESYEVVDWHGNILLTDKSSNATATGDGNYLAVKQDYDLPLEIYAVTYVYDNGQEVAPEDIPAIESEPAETEASEPESEPVETEAAEPVETEAAETEAVVPESEPAEVETETAGPESEPVETETAEPVETEMAEPVETEAAETEAAAPESEPAEAETAAPESEPAEVETEAAAPESEPAEAETTAPADAGTDLDSIIAVLENTVTSIQNTDFEAKREQIAQILDMEVELLASENAEASAILGSVAGLVRSGAGDADSTVLLIQSAIDKLKG